MKLVGELKKKVETLEAPEEVKQVIAEAGMELSDDELNNVDGGWSPSLKKERFICPNCGETSRGGCTFKGIQALCNKCGSVVQYIHGVNEGFH